MSAATILCRVNIHDWRRSFQLNEIEFQDGRAHSTRICVRECRWCGRKNYTLNTRHARWAPLEHGPGERIRMKRAQLG